MSFPVPPFSRPLGDRAWLLWYNRFNAALTDTQNVTWDSVSKAGSKLSDIEERPHSHLTDILPADSSSSDTARTKHTSDDDLLTAVAHYSRTADPDSDDTTRNKHVSNADIKDSRDHRLDLDNPHAVTPAHLDLTIGTYTQAWDADLDYLAGGATVDHEEILTELQKIEIQLKIMAKHFAVMTGAELSKGDVS